MNSNEKHTNESTPASLIYKLCKHISKQQGEELQQTHSFVLRVLTSAPFSSDVDEFISVEKIKKKLVKTGCQRDGLAFSDLYRKLQKSTVLRNRGSILLLLLSLQGTDQQTSKYAQFANELARIAAAVPDISIHSRDFIKTKPTNVPNIAAKLLIAESEKKIAYTDQNGSMGRNKVSSMASMFSRKMELERSSHTSSHSSWESTKTEKTIGETMIKLEQTEETNFDAVFQKDILRDIIYIIQGISGKVIVGRQSYDKFSVTFDKAINNFDKKLILRFAEMGWMFMKISKFCEQDSDKSLGLIAQSFIAAIQTELLEYYRILAVLQSHLQSEVEVNGTKVNLPLTLHRLSIWFMDPYLRLQVLASVVDASKHKRGGALTSVLFSHLQHGSNSIREPVKRLLMMTVKPLYRMLINWIFCGEIEDAFGEFFVIENVTTPESNMWQEKYSLNKSMIPSFFTIEQAKKILSTGKAINFLCQVCNDHSFVKDNHVLKKKHDAKEIESLFLQETESEFHLILEQNYQKTSNLVLHVLHNEHKLMAHFQAMRDYFLLGQGDFIRHIMDLLEPDLAKPANTLYEHVLSGILDSAIRATNAQYHEPEILQRLSVHLQEYTVWDTGRDVFTLNYRVDGPIATVFTNNCMSSYLSLFKSLWRAKRMEYLLSSISQSRTTYLKIQNRIPAVATITFHCHVILAQMVHFVQQMQYYNAFEVMECCWADLLTKIKSAKDLDEVIGAHEIFLDTLLKRSLLKEESSELQNQLKTIYGLIVKFQETQEKFWDQASKLLDMKDEQDLNARQKTSHGKWGTSTTQSNLYSNQLDKFQRGMIPKTKAQLKMLSNQYEDMVQKFLLMLNDHEDQNLRFLSFRLDFNEHFKNRNTRLQTSLTYLHRRQSLK